jgi:hypothetical protein
MSTGLINAVKLSLEEAEKNNSLITNEIINLDGMSGTKTRHFYNNIVRNTPDSRYLEIGTWKGSTTCAAMCGNTSTVLCIDNWVQFGGPKDEFIANFNNYKGANNATFLEKDCFNLDVKTLGKFNIYMYDGEHSRDSHFKALTYYYEALDDTFIYIVDDWNWVDVRQGTLDAIQHLGLEVEFCHEIRTTQNNSTTTDRSGWWNGAYVAVLKKKTI